MFELFEKDGPQVYRLDEILDPDVSQCQVAVPDLGWVTARPYYRPSWRRRLWATWLVFTGRADALVWPEDAPEVFPKVRAFK